MTQQIINVNPANNGASSDSPNAAFTKVNANFSDLYTQVAPVYGAGVSVLSYGADPTGVTDSTAAFAAAAASTPSGANTEGSIGSAAPTIQFAPNGTVYVPAGTYNITSTINTNGVDITWVLADDALIANYAFLNGRIVRNSRRIAKYTYGIGDFANGLYVGVNSGLEQGAPVMGFTSQQQRQTLNYTTFDSVALVFANVAVAPIQTIANAGTTYTATTISFTAALSAAQLAQMRVGMFIGTQHSPSWYGYVTAWTANTITVGGWYQMTGTGTGTPASGTGAYINPITKVFGGNSIASIPAGSIATASAVHEFDTINNLANPGGFGGSPLCWGVDSVNLGTYPAEAAFIARGAWYYGYQIGTQTNNANATVYGFVNKVTYGAIVTNASGAYNAPTVPVGTAMSTLTGYQAAPATIAGTVTNQIGFSVGALTGATYNLGFYGTVAAATNNYNLYMPGTAYNYLAGQLGVGVGPLVSQTLTTGATTNTGTTQSGIQAQDTLSGTTASLGLLIAQAITASTAVAAYTGAQVNNPTLNAGATITTNVGLQVGALSSGGTHNYGIVLGVPSGSAGAYNIFANGTANNLMNGNLNLASGAAAAVSGGLCLGGTQQTTVGATGAASALPANPLGYLIAYVGATKIAIPYYNG